MRDIDTQVLLGVAPSLGVGNPATATGQVVFDDSNLQQMWDASKFARFPRLTACLNFACSANAGATNREALTLSELYTQTQYRGVLEELGFTPANSDVYIVGFAPQVSLSSAAHLSEYQFGVSAHMPNASAASPVVLAFSNQENGTVPLITADQLLTLQNDIERPDEWPGMLPMKLTAGSGPTDPDVLHAVVVSAGTGQTVTRTVVKLHFCLKGMPIWYDLRAG